MPPSSNRPPVPRRTLRELRLEQIAIWGDAAAYRTQPTPPPTNPSSPPQATRLPRAATFTNARSSSRPPMHTDILDIEPVTAEGLQPAPNLSDAGSMGHMNTLSAENFRRSGSYAAVARAEARQVTFDRPRSISITAATPRSEIRESRWSNALWSDTRKGREKLDLEATWDRRRDSIEMRERDENEFRNGNAKLPERLDSIHVPPVADGLQLRRCRTKLPVLGRYTRSRASQLPITRRTPGRIETTVDAAR